MPTYEYACPKCGIVEVFQSIKEAALTKCPTCKKAKVQRMVSLGGGVIFKGSGFWETDYNRSSDYQTKSKADRAEPTTASSDKSDSAPTTKSDTPQPKTAPQPKAAPDAKPASETKSTPQVQTSAQTKSTGKNPNKKA